MRGPERAVVGAIVCAIGTAITAGTMSASSGPGGGHVIVAWGAIIWGLVWMLQGLGECSAAQVRTAAFVGLGGAALAGALLLANGRLKLDGLKSLGSAPATWAPRLTRQEIEQEMREIEAQGMRPGLGRNMQITGGEYGVGGASRSPLACRARCRDDTNCHAYSFNIEFQSCMLHMHFWSGGVMLSKDHFSDVVRTSSPR